MADDFRRRVQRRAAATPRVIAVAEDGRVRTRDEFGVEADRGDAYDDDLHERNGTAAPPPEPIEAIPDPWPAPPAEEAYYGLAGEIVRRVEPETESDPAAVLIQYLTAFGNAAGRAAYCAVGKDRHHGNLYCVLVGKTSYGGKGQSWRWVEHVISQACAEWHEESVMGGLSSGEGLIKVAEDVRDDTGRRILAVEEEFARLLASMGREHNTLSAVLRQGWDGGRLSVATRQNPLRADRVHLSLIGHITPDELASCLAKNDRSNGFANRILWVAVQRSKLLPDGGRDLDIADLAFDTRAAVDFAREAQYIHRTDAAAELWREAYPRLRAERPGLLGLVTTRAAAQTLRLSLLYALLDRSRRINTPHLEAALAVWDYCERTCRWVFGKGTGEGLADDILEGLRQSRGGLTRDEIGNLLGRNHSATEIDAALNTLNRQGRAVGKKFPTGKPGRPPERWEAMQQDGRNEKNEIIPPAPN